MRFRGGEFSTGTTGNFQSELTVLSNPGDSREGVRRQLEEVAAPFAEVLQANVRPSQRYDFDGVALEARAG